MDQAHRDLEHARVSIDSGHFEWACFAAQQAAEKAVKAVYEQLGGVAWGHSVTELLQGLGERTDVPEDFLDLARGPRPLLRPGALPERAGRREPQGLLHEEGRRRCGP